MTSQHPAYQELQDAVDGFGDWPTNTARGRVVDAALRFVALVKEQAQAIEYMRQHVTPTDEALAQVMATVTNELRCVCGHRMHSEHHGNYSGSRACDYCTCPASRQAT